MQKQEGAVILIPADILARCTVLAGNDRSISNASVTIFDSLRLAFLSDLSRHLLADARVRSMPDVATFAYWIRSANLNRIANTYKQSSEFRVGLGLSFHICPANVPVNFAFSMAFGLLAGNSCVLRLPSRSSETVDVLVESISSLLREPKYHELNDGLHLIRYEHDDVVNRHWLAMADGRIVWGGDATVAHMRSMPCAPRSREVAFSDRYSFAVLDPRAVLDLDKNELSKLCAALFNDIYLMDQGACSSPQLYVWLGSDRDVEIAKSLLWPALASYAKERYTLQPVHVMDKYVQLCSQIAHNTHISSVQWGDNWLYRVELSDVQSDQEQCRGYFGTVYEVTLDSLERLAFIVNERYQTLTYFGIDIDTIKKWLMLNKVRGIDRVVPIGKAIDMDVIWDGYDIIRSLSREVTIE